MKVSGLLAFMPHLSDWSIIPYLISDISMPFFPVFMREPQTFFGSRGSLATSYDWFALSLREKWHWHIGKVPRFIQNRWVGCLLEPINSLYCKGLPALTWSAAQLNVASFIRISFLNITYNYWSRFPALREVIISLIGEEPEREERNCFFQATYIWSIWRRGYGTNTSKQSMPPWNLT